MKNRTYPPSDIRYKTQTNCSRIAISYGYILYLQQLRFASKVELMPGLLDCVVVPYVLVRSVALRVSIIKDVEKVMVLLLEGKRMETRKEMCEEKKQR